MTFDNVIVNGCGSVLQADQKPSVSINKKCHWSFLKRKWHFLPFPQLSPYLFPFHSIPCQGLLVLSSLWRGLQALSWWTKSELRRYGINWSRSCSALKSIHIFLPSQEYMKVAISFCCLKIIGYCCCMLVKWQWWTQRLVYRSGLYTNLSSQEMAAAVVTRKYHWKDRSSL